VGAATTRSGRSVVLFKQTNASGISNLLIAAESSTSSPNWQLTEFNTASTNTFTLFGADDGTLRIINLDSCTQGFNKSGSWSFIAMPANCKQFNGSFNRNGDYIGVEYSAGASRWFTYDAMRNKNVFSSIASGTTGANSGCVAGDGQTTGNWRSYATSLLATGLGVQLIYGQYDVLPTVSAPAGDGRANVNKLWGFYLR
jgi:hypothetical protein